MKICFQNNVLSSRFRRELLFLPACAVLFVFLSATVASAGLSGQASLIYSAFAGRYNGAVKSSASSLVQDYSLLYSKKDFIYSSRVGRYDVSLGYNWTSIDSTIKSSHLPTENFSVARGHLLFKGEVLLDPKEIPLHLYAFSRDMNNNATASSVGRYEDGSALGYRSQTAYVLTGTRIDNGVTMTLGAKRGMTGSSYEFIDKLPTLFVDYKDSINNVYGATGSTNNRLSRLAFVSLNKKDNWLHYRITNYYDYLDSTNSYTEKQFQLGTVDQRMQRHWVDFSNWLKVSTDIQFSSMKKNYLSNASEDINLNLFVAADRKSWNARTFTSFDRIKDEKNTISYQTNIPLYVDGVISKDMAWNARVSFRDTHDVDVSGARSKTTSMLAGYRLDAFKNSPFTLSQSLNVESMQSDMSDMITFSGTIETASTPSYSRKVTLGASYNANDSQTTVSGNQTNLLVQTLNLRGSYTLTNKLSFAANQSLTYTTGKTGQFNGTTRDSYTQLPQYSNPRGLIDVGSESLNSVSHLSVSWTPKPRLVIAFGVTEDIYKTASIVSAVTEANGRVSYSNSSWTVDESTTYTHGNRAQFNDRADSISNSASLKYTHSRNLDASASASYSLSTADGSGFSHSTSFEQRINYNVYAKVGVGRKLLEFNETLLYSDGSADLNNNFTRSLSLGIKYYPISRLILSGSLGYSYSTKFSDYTFIGNTSLAVNFQLVQASFDYSHAIRKIDGAIEDKFTGNIRKKF